jgi:hypothetical protein
MASIMSWLRCSGLAAEAAAVIASSLSVSELTVHSRTGLDGTRCGESPSKCASNVKFLSGRTDMTLRFLAIDPDTNGENCPALFLEEETGDLLFQGAAVTDPVVLAESGTHSPLGETEGLVRLPARMRTIILEALSGDGSAVQ